MHYAKSKEKEGIFEDVTGVSVDVSMLNDKKKEAFEEGIGGIGKKSLDKKKNKHPIK